METRVLADTQHRRAVTVRAGSCGDPVVRALAVADELQIRAALVNPTRTRADVFARNLLRLSTGLSPEAIATLSRAQVTRLVLAIVRLNGWEGDWRRLYGSHLSSDERLLAVAVWGAERRQRALVERLRERRGAEVAAPSRTSAVRGVDTGVLSQTAIRSLSAFQSQIPSIADPLRGVRGGLFELSRGGSAFGIFRDGAEPMRGAMELLRGVSVATRQIKTVGAFGDPTKGIGAALEGIVPHFESAPGIAAVVRAQKLEVQALALRGAVRSPLADVGVANGLALLTRSPTITGSWRSPLIEIANSFKSLSPVIDLASVFAKSSLASAFAKSSLDGFAAQVAQAFESGGLFRAFEGIQEEFRDVARFMEAWENDPLWFLLQALGMRASRQLASLSRRDVERVVLQALEDVVLRDELVPALRELLPQLPDLTERDRMQLDHALEHAQRGEWLLGVPHFHIAFEALLFRAAARRGLIVPGRRKKIRGAEGVLKLIFDATDHFTLFVVTRVYGGAGNALRHGRADSGEREVLLAGIVALAGYLDHALGLDVVETLGWMIERRVGALVAAEAVPTLELSGT